MPTVKILVAGSNNLNLAEKGDVIDVVPFESDWGNATVSPNWIRLSVTDVAGATQAEAEDLARAWLNAWEKEFVYSEVGGASGGLQRYRVEASPEIANDFDLVSKLEMRDRILVRFGGVLANQSGTHFEFDAPPDVLLDEIEQEIRSFSFRRFSFPEALVDQALGTGVEGEPIEFSRTFDFTRSVIVDKLRD